MNLKIEALKGCIFILIGAYLFTLYAPKSAPIAEQRSSQSQDCKAVFKRTVKPDGSVDEIAEFLSNNSQKHEQKITSPKSKNNSLSIGASSNLKGTIDLQINKHSFQVLSDGKKDHVLIYKLKILEF